MNILIVDDQPTLARITAVAFHTLGCRTRIAGTLSTARYLLSAEKFDAIFADVNLRGESGYELLGQLGERHAQVPVVMFTAQTKEEIGEEAIRRGAFDYLVKPFTLDGLRYQLARIREHLELAREKIAPPASPHVV
jgi:DNA-binding NtrC family response regulator